MNYIETLSKIRSSAFDYGEFTLRAEESINDVVKREKVPQRYGVYIVSGCHKKECETIYIGKSGTIMQNGDLGKQGLRKRLTMKQEGMYRRVFFPKIIKEYDFDFLHIEWFVTYLNGNGIPPFLAEAELIAAFLKTSRCLPMLNKNI